MKIYYHNDLDGKCAAAIVYQTFADWTADCVAVNYNLPFPLESVQAGEVVYIVDYSLSVTDMWSLLDITPNVTWIDHHRTAIERFAGDERVNHLPGIRSCEWAGCVLTWQYLLPHKNIPLAVSLIGDYDTWKFTFPDSLQFYLGMLARDTHPRMKLWQTLFNEDTLVPSIVDQGIVIEQYRKEWGKEYVKSWSFEGKLDGHSVLFLNIGSTGSTIFGQSVKDYDIVSTYVFDGKQFIVSLYSQTVDVGRIAEGFNGGGHKGAAGFEISPLGFYSLLLGGVE